MVMLVVILVMVVAMAVVRQGVVIVRIATSTRDLVPPEMLAQYCFKIKNVFFFEVGEGVGEFKGEFHVML